MSYFEHARSSMAHSQIHPDGVTNPAVLNVFSTMPRERFLPDAGRNLAYADRDFPFEQAGRFLMKPRVHAKLLEFAMPGKDDLALDVGCMTGYSSAILSYLCGTVIALEENERALDTAKGLWEEFTECNIVPVSAPFGNGVPDYAPYSLIMLNGSVPEVPQALLAQLDEDGRLLTVLLAPGAAFGRAVMVYKDGSIRFLFDAYAPPLPGIFADGSSFVF